jgi:hypothetical protein
MKYCKAFFAFPLLFCGCATAFSTASKPRRMIQLHENASNDQGMLSRRALLGVLATTLLMEGGVINIKQPAMAASQADMNIPITPFNGLIFNYRGGDYGGLDASTLNGEPSVPYQEFVKRLKKGEVKFVEFMAPDGDVAYVTFNSDSDSSSKPIRIGEVRVSCYFAKFVFFVARDGGIQVVCKMTVICAQPPLFFDIHTYVGLSN